MEKWTAENDKCGERRDVRLISVALTVLQATPLHRYQKEKEEKEEEIGESDLKTVEVVVP